MNEPEAGPHADEIETSMMLYVAPHSVNMAKAARDFHPGSGRPIRRRAAYSAYSPTGIHDEVTPASAGKGRRVVEAIVRRIVSEVDALRALPLPERTRQ